MIRNIESILNIYNYFDGIIVTDKKGIINSYEVRLPLTKATKETQEKIDNFLNNIDNI